MISSFEDCSIFDLVLISISNKNLFIKKHNKIFMFFKNKVVILTGGSGFLGRYVLAELKNRGAANIFIPRSRDFDLRVAADISRMFQLVQQNYPDMPIIVIHMAAAVGGSVLI